MPPASFTGTFDVAELAFYVFVLFFLGLVFYLRREDKREGYPLQTDRKDGRVTVQGFPFPPGPKKFRLYHEPQELTERRERDLSGILAPAERWPGAPFVPLGDPMQDGVGSASYAERSDVPDRTFDDQRMIFSRFENSRQTSKNRVRRNGVKIAQEFSGLRITDAVGYRPDLSEHDPTCPAWATVLENTFPGYGQMAIPG